MNVWILMNVTKMIHFALVASVSTRTDHIIVSVRPGSGTMADDVLMLTNVKFKTEIVKNFVSIPKAHSNVIVVMAKSYMLTDIVVSHTTEKWRPRAMARERI